MHASIRTFSTPSSRLLLLALALALLCSCASVPPGSDFPRTPSVALAQPEQTWIGQRLAAPEREHGGQSGFRLLPLGVDGFLARAQMIDAAERTLDVQYFIFRQDDTGKLLTDALLRAADRGVRVRVLVDDMETAGEDARIATLDAHPNVEIRVFNPFAERGNVTFLRALELAFNFSRLDYRMHNKLMVADNSIALVGGRNVADEYFQVGTELQFGDYDVFVAGPIVKELSGTFDEYWQSPLAIPVRALATGEPPAAALAAYRNTLDDHRQQIKSDGTDYAGKIATGEPLAGLLSGRLPLVWANAQVICDSPEKQRVVKGEMVGRLMHQRVAEAATAVTSELLVVSPYFVPGKGGMRLLSSLRERGVRVGILTNSLETMTGLGPTMAYASYGRYRPSLLEAGVELYETRPVLGRPKGSGGRPESENRGRFALHAKIFVFDRQRLFIGSMNFDQRSMYLNTEVGLIIDSPELARQTAARFEAIAQPANSYVLALRPDGPGGSPRVTWLTRTGDDTVELDSVPGGSAWQRAVAALFSLVPFDDEL